MEEEYLCDHVNMAFAAISYFLPNFAFYMHNQMVELELLKITTADFEAALNTRSSNLQLLNMPFTIQTQTKWPNGVQPSTRSSET